MKILHTADWHLGDRLGRIDRTDDLRKAVERVAKLCGDEKVDLLLVAGDLFSELSRPDNLRSTIEHLQQVFEGFLLGGGTILAVTGNHDNENFCQTLRLVMTLAAPAAAQPGDLQPSGRLYLATNPTFLRLAGRDGHEVQFVLMPYPTATRYLRDEQAQRYATLEEKNRHLQSAYASWLKEIQEHPRYDAGLPTVLSAHIHVQGATLPSLFRMSEEESIVFSGDDIPANVAYAALGHIHQHQCLAGQPHIRYAGSIERLDLGEQKDQKGVVLLELGEHGLKGEPAFVPLPATPIYAIDVHEPKTDIPKLRDEHAFAQNDLVNLQFRYTAGKDNLEEILRDLEKIFPRWYARHWVEASALADPLTTGEHQRGKSFEETVRDYLKQELMNHSDEDREAVLMLAETHMKEVQA
jgi:DNA repair protein SbcD/Mre11